MNAMAIKVTRLFSEQDLKRIESAVHEAEQRTGGEIVPYAVLASDAYEHALWRAGFLSSAIAFSAFILIYHMTELSWQPFVAAELAIATLAGGVAGMMLASYIPAVKRLFAGKHAMDLRVRQRATDAFLAEEVFDTRERSGILIFLSFLERKVIVLGDSGINAKVAQEEWNAIVTKIADGMRTGKPADAIVEAIRNCGSLLERHGVARRPDDTDELKNRMRMG